MRNNNINLIYFCIFFIFSCATAHLNLDVNPQYSFDDIKNLSTAIISSQKNISFQTFYQSISGLFLSGNRILSERIKYAFDHSGQFLNVTQGMNGDYHFEIIIYDGANYWDTTLAWLNLLTATLLPNYYVNDFTYKINIFKNKKLAKYYEYSNRSISLFVWAPLVVIAPFTSENKAFRVITDNILLNFLYDLKKDNIII